MFGYYQGAASKWRKAREVYQWDLLAELCPKIAEKYDEPPNWLRERLGVDNGKGPAHTKITADVYNVVDRILQDASQEGFELSIASAEEVISDAISAYNEQVQAWRTGSERAQLQTMNNLIASGASEDEIAQQVKLHDAQTANWPNQIDVGKTTRSLNQLAISFAKKYGFGSYTQDKPARHLPRNHPQVQHVTEFILTSVKEDHVHPKLLGNADQVWTCLFEPMRRVLWKSCEQGPKDSLSRFPGRQALRSKLQEHFGEAIQVPKHEQKKTWSVKLADIEGYGGTNTVNHWRTAALIVFHLSN